MRVVSNSFEELARLKKAGKLADCIEDFCIQGREVIATMCEGTGLEPLDAFIALLGEESGECRRFFENLAQVNASSETTWREVSQELKARSNRAKSRLQVVN